ncbi:MAG TPA: hypothetical protein VFK10_21215 [Burkholderiaceae bacterium]|nr:hypothetical protein [Burkholderiaceae bacterium]
MAEPSNKPAAWRRWLGIVLRASHIAAVTALGAALLGAPLARLPAAALVLASGAALLVIEAVDARMRFHELAGFVALSKFAAVAWMVLDGERALQAFWVVLVVSALVSHAPRRVRHWRPGRGPG